MIQQQYTHMERKTQPKHQSSRSELETREAIFLMAGSLLDIPGYSGSRLTPLPIKTGSTETLLQLGACSPCRTLVRWR